MKSKKMWINFVVLTVMAASILTLGVFISRNISLNRLIDKEKVSSEVLVSEKLALEKSLTNFRNEISSLEGKNKEMDEVLINISSKLAEKEIQVRKLLSENAAIGDFRKKIVELSELQSDLEKQKSALDTELKSAQARNFDLLSNVDALRLENQRLLNQNDLLEAMLSDNYRIEAHRGKKEKLTLVARKADALEVSFDIPRVVTNQLYFKISSPDGEEISSKGNEYTSINLYPVDQNLTASITEVSSNPARFETRVELAYNPVGRLKKGIYNFKIYDGSEYIGAVQLRLK